LNFSQRCSRTFTLCETVSSVDSKNPTWNLRFLQPLIWRWQSCATRHRLLFLSLHRAFWRFTYYHTHQ
jgi:hypothetical protein